MKQESSSFELLESKVQQWVWEQGWNSLNDIQENSIPLILNCDSDVIISAATAGGKTEAVFLPILTNILKNENNGGCQVLYISPLKSLINDQYRRLADMTQGMSVNVTPWHGDISSNKKRRFLNNPNGILIITPESLESLFMHHHDKLRNAFDNLMYIIIDELHAFIPTERGKQLQSLMSRLEFVIRRHVPRIAMSATFSDYDSVKHFLRQDHSLSCIIPKQGKSNHEIKVLLKEYTYKYNEKQFVDKKITDDIFARLRGSNNLVFTNSRRECEHICSLLNEKSEEENVPNEFRIHHGSISKDIRREVENDLQSGKTPITAICTATLELGVDIGKVKSIAQIETAITVSGLRQRLGRSGRRDEASILRIYSSDYNDSNAELLDYLRANLVQNIAVLELLKEHKYEKPNINGIHFSTLIQQVLSIIAEYGSFYPQDGWKLLCKHGAFDNISPHLFMDLLKDLGRKKVIKQMSSGQIIISSIGEEILRDKEFYAAFTTYPEIDVINMQNGQHIGSLLVQFVGVGSCIVFCGQKWKIVDVSYNDKRAYVIPFDYGEEQIFKNDCVEIDPIITKKMKEIYLSDEIYPYLDKRSEAIKCLIDARTFFQKKHLDSIFSTYKKENIILTWAGSKVNRTISLISKLYLDKVVGYNHIYLSGLKKEDISELLKRSKPVAKTLCPFLMREAKEINKYDYLLSDDLLDIQYASMYLDVDKVWNYLLQIS